MPISRIGTDGIDQTSSQQIGGISVGRGGGAVSTNTAVGASALAGSNTGSGQNTGVGNLALNANTSGAYNSAVGSGALYSNTTGSNNVAVGQNALVLNTTASNNTAVGYQALYTNTTLPQSTAIGFQALYNATGGYNTAVGYAAAAGKTTGDSCTFIGRNIAGATHTGGSCVFVGDSSGAVATSGNNNTFVGTNSGGAVTSGGKNTILGNYTGNQGGVDIRTSNNYIVLSDGDGNPQMVVDNGGQVAFRFGQTTFGSGGFAFTYDSTNVYMQTYASKPLVINTLGNAVKMPQVYSGYTTGSAANMFISSDGTLYRSTSSLKYKKNVQDAVYGLSDVLKLRAVTYQGKDAVVVNDAGEDVSVPASEQVLGGLIAEEVHEAGLTQFVQYAEDGTPDALAYGNMVSLLVKAIQELKAEFDAYKEAHP